MSREIRERLERLIAAEDALTACRALRTAVGELEAIARETPDGPTAGRAADAIVRIARELEA